MDRLRGYGVAAGVLGISIGVAFLKWQAGLITLSAFVLIGSILGMYLGDERDTEISGAE